MLDIDSTLTGDGETAGRVRAMLEAQGYLVVFNTSRTEEMVMSRAAYAASRATGRFHRPPPHLGHAGDRRVDVPQEEAEPAGLLDPDIIAGSTGTQILVRQQDGAYLPDEQYGVDEPLEPCEWRERVLALVEAINTPNLLLQPAAIEYLENYGDGVSDVYPPDYRMQLGFARQGDGREAACRLNRIRAADIGSLTRTARGVRLLDDSEPRNGRYKSYIVPRWASKARAARRIIERLCQDTGMRREQMYVLFVGDSYPDLHMALVGGAGLEATLLLVGGSRLTDVLGEPDTTSFAGISLRAVKKRLTRTERQGYLRYRGPGAGDTALTVVLGDKAFPGTESAQTVEDYLRSLKHT